MLACWRSGNRENQPFKMACIQIGKISPFTEGAVNFIIDKSGYIPRKILENCEKIGMAMKGKKEITINDAQSILKTKQENQNFIQASLSPMEESILIILKETNKTAQELAELLKRTEGSVGKQ